MSKRKHYVPISSSELLDTNGNHTRTCINSNDNHTRTRINSNGNNGTVNNSQVRSASNENPQNSTNTSNSRDNNNQHKNKKKKNNFFMKVIFDLNYINHRHMKF